LKAWHISSFQCLDEIVEYIENGIESGRWANISDAIRDSLRDIVKREKQSKDD
jgi:Arc/MetJ-type ribon-helix-helix transcriptional regulator